MGRLIDADNFEVVSIEGRSEEFSDGVMWMLEQLDNAPTVDAISRKTVKEMVAEIEKLFLCEIHSDIDLGKHIALSDVLNIIHKYTKEQNNDSDN